MATYHAPSPPGRLRRLRLPADLGQMAALSRRAMQYETEPGWSAQADEERLGLAEDRSMNLRPSFHARRLEEAALFERYGTRISRRGTSAVPG